MLPHTSTTFKIKNCYRNEPRFKDAYSRNNLTKNLPNTMKDGGYIVNCDDYKLTGTHWIDFYIINNYVRNFDSFGVEHIPEEIMRFISSKTIVTNIIIYRPITRQCVETFILDLCYVQWQKSDKFYESILTPQF